MPYPIISHGTAHRWWKNWKDSGQVVEPPPAPDPEEAVDGDAHDWPSIASDLMEELGALYNSVDGQGSANPRPVSSGGRAAGKPPKTNDRFEAEACVRIHRFLPFDPALADPEFWIWMAVGPGVDLIRRRYSGSGRGKGKVPDYLNFTSGNAQETLFFRLWIRADFTFDENNSDDPYELARYGDIDFWRSHVFRQSCTESDPLLSAFIRFQHPNGPNGKTRLSQGEIRELVKYMRRAATNVMVEVLDEHEAMKFVEEQWRKI